MSRRARTRVWKVFNYALFLVFLFLLGAFLRGEWMLVSILTVIFLQGATRYQTIKGKLNPNVYEYTEGL